MRANSARRSAGESWHGGETRCPPHGAAPGSPPIDASPIRSSVISHSVGIGRRLGWRCGTPLPIALPMQPDDPETRLNAVREAIARAARLADRKADTVALIAVSKTKAAEEIEPLLAAGQRAVRRESRAGGPGKWPALREAWPDVAASPGRPAPVEQGRRGGQAVRRDPFGRSLLADRWRSPARWSGRAGGPVVSSRSISAMRTRRVAARSTRCPLCWPRRERRGYDLGLMAVPQMWSRRFFRCSPAPRERSRSAQLWACRAITRRQ